MAFQPRDPRLLNVAIAFVLVGVVGLYCATTGHCQDRPSKAFTVTAVTFAGLASVDAAQSIPCLHSATCREMNPLYARTSPAGFVAVKTATVGAATAYAWNLRKRHPKWAWTLLGSMTALQGAVVVSNAHQRGRR